MEARDFFFSFQIFDERLRFIILTAVHSFKKTKRKVRRLLKKAKGKTINSLSVDLSIFQNVGHSLVEGLKSLKPSHLRSIRKDFKKQETLQRHIDFVVSQEELDFGIKRD